MVPELRRRRQPRLNVRVPVVTQSIEVIHDAALGVAEDLSTGGVRLRQKKAAAPGAKVLVTLRFRRHLAVSMLGTVVWAQPHSDSAGWDLGIRFAGELGEKAVTEITNPDVTLCDVSGGA